MSTGEEALSAYHKAVSVTTLALISTCTVISVILTQLRTDLRFHRRVVGLVSTKRLFLQPLLPKATLVLALVTSLMGTGFAITSSVYNRKPEKK